MNAQSIFADTALLFMIAFFVSEVVLSRVRKSSTMTQDHNSLRVLYLAIGLSITAGSISYVYGIGIYGISDLIKSALCIGLIVIGAVIRWVAIWQLGKHFTVAVEVKSDHELQQSGLYKWVRHPSYSGLMLEFIGLSFYFNSWVSHVVILFPITLSLIYRIRVEEQALLEHFGDDYVYYAKTTARLIPGIW